MKTPVFVRSFVTLLLVGCLLSPISVLAYGDAGKKHFNAGMKFEVSEQWDKAAEEYALAVSENPKNPEYRLHLTRSLFNASQMFVKKGSAAAKDGDYEAAYNAFKRAYAFDPTNELAKAEMDRMVRMQKDALDAASGKKESANGVKVLPTSYGGNPGQQMPQKLEKLRDLPFAAGVDLKFIIKELAKDLDLNVLFDGESLRGMGDKKISIDLKNVTAARALDYIFLQEGLFFQKVGPRTILIAIQTQRVKFQQLALRTFYLANAAPKDVAKVVQTAIPAQPGRSQTIVLTDDATNSITVRDTRENIALIGKLISSLDKDRAEVVMDVAIYEVNKSDLLQLGNQIGTASQLNNIGGTAQGAVGFGHNILNTLQTGIVGAAATTFPTSIPTGIILPAANLQAFSSRQNTRLVASTQIHAFNNEDSSARIGQRVPVQSAQFVTAANTSNGGVVSNVINYEQIGLTLKFKPLVFPNQDVQVAMEIENKDVVGASTLTPTFTERTVKGTARIQNNKTLLVASVATGVETHGNSGLPLVGLIPILGRLFTSPSRDNRAVDIVIAVTPRVIRAPEILPEDEVERDTGSLQVPTNNTLEAMIIQEENEEQNLAQVRRIPNNVQVQLPDAAPQYVKTESGSTTPAVVPASNESTAAMAVKNDQTTAAAIPVKNDPVPTVTTMPENLKPIDNGVKTLQLKQTSDTSAAPVEAQTKAAEPSTETAVARTLQLRFGTELPEMKAGQKMKVAILSDASTGFRSGLVGLKFDETRVAIRSVAYGDVFGSLAESAATPFINQSGKMYVSLTGKDEGAKTTGVLAVIEIEALADGKPAIAFDKDVLNFLTADGKNFLVKY